MQENRSLFTALSTTVGAGAAVAILSWLGLGHMLPSETIAPVARDTELPNAVIEYPAVDGAVSFSSDMWDDPFRLSDVASKKLVPKGSSKIRETIESKLDDEGHIMHVVVPVVEGTSKEAVESRSRYRHAVELALANQGFTLAFADRMSFRQATYNYYFAPSQSEYNKLSTPRTIVIPFKLYRHHDDKHFILVSWVQETNFGRRPLNCIEQLLKDVAPVGETQERASLCILGPNSSDTLKKIISDAGNYPDGCATEKFYANWKQGVILCNIACTASDRSLGLEPGQSKLSLGKGKEKTAIKLIHTIGSDERLFQTVRHELELRGVWPSESSSGRMVLFAEQSSLSYVADLKSLFSTSGGLDPLFIPYLKGISKSEDQWRSVKDYLDRSMNRLAARPGTDPNRSEPVKLIGILGSNWEDKNLILEKARPAFPVATFFTIELDSRYSRRDVLAHGRNLIIASHFGLRVDGRPDIFGQVSSIPRFRDQYQTSGFIGMSIVGKAFYEDQLQADTFPLTYGELSQDLFDIVGRRTIGPQIPTSPKHLKPCVFEVGRTEAVQLQSEPSMGHSYLPLRQPPPTPSIHQRPWMATMVFVVLIIMLIVFNTVSTFSTDARVVRTSLWAGVTNTVRAIASVFTGQPIKVGSTLWSQLIAVAIGVAILGVMIHSSFAVESEPIMIGEGISIWPAVIGLYAVIAFSIASLNNLFKIPPPQPESQLSFDNKSARGQTGLDAGACKIAGAIVIGFYLISYFESGFIMPPARDWTVRWLAIAILFIATGCIVLIACRCLIYALIARKIIRNYENLVESDSPEQIAEHCHRTMELSIQSSLDLVIPAILSLMFIAARSTYWDAWGLDVSWYFLIGVPIVTCLIAAAVVRITAISYRHKSLDSLRKRRFDQLVGSSQRRGREDIGLIDQAIDEIKTLNRGPYGPISRDYILGAVGILLAVAVSGPIGSVLQNLIR